MSLNLCLPFTFALAACLSFPAAASIVVSPAPEKQLASSDAVFRGTVLQLRSFEESGDGYIYTAAYVQVEETFKGKLPSVVKVICRGGSVGGRGEMDDLSPQFRVGEERLLFVSMQSNGTLAPSLGGLGALRLRQAGEALRHLRNRTATGPLMGIDFTAQAVSLAELKGRLSGSVAEGPPPPSYTPHSNATNLMVGTDLIPARFLAPDRGEPIPYYVDADFLPAGISLQQALDAVTAALAAWTNVTSARFAFAGLQSFRMAAPNLQARDGSLWIQLHDAYGFIPSTGEILGQGGRGWSIRNLTTGWTLGGNVQGNDFHQVTKGYVVMKHTAAFLQNPANFAEVLCHEVGHALGLDHSSEDPNESNAVLMNAIMYYRAHGNGRGATLAAFDEATSQQVHPRLNTPPFTFDRVIEVVTTPNPQSFSVPGVNSVVLPAYDLQPGPLSVDTADPNAPNGTFTLNANTLAFVPDAFWSEATGNFDSICTRCSDGVNASPYATVRVVAFRPDDYSEGVPNSWRLTWFGTEDPNAVPAAHAQADPDGDGLPNVTEFLLGSDPTDPLSNLRITSFSADTIQWQAKQRELYEIQSSTNLVDWQRAAVPVIATNAPMSFDGLPTGGPQQSFRILRAP